MQPLKLNQKFLTLVSLCAPTGHVTRSEIILNAAVGLYVFVTLCLDFVSSSFFVIQYKKRGLEDVLGSIMQIAAVSSNIFGMVTVFGASKRLRTIFSLYQAIYNDCDYSSNSIRKSILYPCQNHLVSFLFIRCSWWILSYSYQDQSALCKGHQNIGYKICARLLCIVSHTWCGQCHVLLYQRRWNRHKMPLHPVQAHVSWHLCGMSYFNMNIKHALFPLYPFKFAMGWWNVYWLVLWAIV